MPHVGISKIGPLQTELRIDDMCLGRIIELVPRRQTKTGAGNRRISASISVVQLSYLGTSRIGAVLVTEQLSCLLVPETN